LQSLELIPNATLIVTVPRSGNTQRQQEPKPWFYVRAFNWVSNYMGWNNNNTENNTNNQDVNEEPKIYTNREEGIHTLRQSEDEEKDKDKKNKSFNGNSIEHM